MQQYVVNRPESLSRRIVNRVLKPVEVVKQRLANVADAHIERSNDRMLAKLQQWLPETFDNLTVAKLKEIDIDRVFNLLIDIRGLNRNPQRNDAVAFYSGNKSILNELLSLGQPSHEPGRALAQVFQFPGRD